ncbi:DUF3419 family protein [Portibacter lacus]|uniref:S-adenosylmethionine--diacylglycerol 3-amino-3-carboxypropyl transferase n=1 Tax=Portibacter lacus TaxID=1099794 RepID=A0AA37SS78_9BACT|nr:DUF3419 family protein [Portibacter lacus]GLR18669.1 S-adenosylmethionine--diacylglycerol 3-amino-3-carboxypropyl transferase [Portibacter lacus]
MSEKHLDEVDHSYIRYANVWEDPKLLLEGLDICHEHKVLSIASAGDNALALLVTNPKIVVAIDLNKPQLYLTELKKVAIQNLDQDAFVKFAGFQDDSRRWRTFMKFRDDLSAEARTYWNGKKEEIEKGIIYNGKFEKYLKTFATKLLPLIHSRKKVQELFEEKSAADQRKFYDQKWNTWRWRLLFRVFFSKLVMGWLGRDPAFLEQVDVDVSTTIFEKAENHLSSIYAQKNPILYYCLNGNFGSYLPFYAREENYENVRGNLDKLEIEYGYAQDAAVKYGQFDRFNLSNIFEYMDEEVFTSTAESLVNIANPGSRFAYWNLMVERQMSEVVEGLSREDDRANWKDRDEGFFYKQFVLETT